jgi:HAD superfamily hydrolase (TIGR01509 family)
MHLPAAVLWDMDGTLVDSEPYWILSETKLASEYQFEWQIEDGHSLIGLSLYESAQIIRSKVGIDDLTDEEIIEKLTTAVVDQLGERLPWRPGALELLSELKAHGVKTALVTMSMRRMATAVADSIGFPAFDAVVAGDDVSRGKPHPEPYLRALELLQVDAEHCIAIEDSRTGVTSAEAAGCLTIGVPHLAGIPEGPGRVILPSLSGVNVSMLTEILRGRNV